GMQDLALQSQGFMEFINQYYVTSHFAVTVTVMFWIYLRRPFVYARLRWVLIAITLAALAIHVAFPLAPPRMMSGTGLIDTLKAYGPSIYGSPESGSANQFAAMPSLHFGYAALAAWGILLSFRTRWRYLALTHPVLMLFAIMATANHYWIDAAVAGVLLVVSGIMVWWLVNVPEEQAATLERMRPSDDTGSTGELEFDLSGSGADDDRSLVDV
ncbi:MAG: phosphatase PAP2 family protein, partial [Acidimicrobiia bacterium]|nr:phosphatase PAP2 family protein [Acidimicrobiia bacterium]